MSGLQAMAVARLYPEPDKGGRGKQKVRRRTVFKSNGLPRPGMSSCADRGGEYSPKAVGAVEIWSGGGRSGVLKWRRRANSTTAWLHS